MRRVLLAVLCAIVFPVGHAMAAPQILGLVATADTPTELKCVNGTCSAEFSAICLQQGREAPKNGTPYAAVDSAALTFVVTGKDGVQTRLPAAGLAISSARSYAAVTIRIPESAVRALGGDRVAVEVGQGAALTPVAKAGDPEPQTQQDIAGAIKTYRAVGQATLADSSPLAHGYRGMMAMVNALPRGEPQRTDMQESRLARDTLRSVGMPAEARAFTEERLEFCENLTSSGWHTGGLRPCLQQQHDAFITNKNHAYWNAAGAGS
jgi:hypothetical protein